MANTTTRRNTTPKVTAPKQQKETPKVKKVLEPEVPLEKEEEKENLESPVQQEQEVLLPEDSFYRIESLQRGKYEVRLYTERGFKVLKKGSYEKCENYLKQIKA